MGSRRQEETIPRPNHLREWRGAAGLTQAEVQKILNWHHGRVSHLETNTALVTNEVLVALASVYGCEPGDLLGPVPRELLREALGYQAPRQRENWAPADPIIETLTNLLSEFFKLRGELRTIKKDSLSRLDFLDGQLAQMTQATADAIKATSETTEKIERNLISLKDRIGRVSNPPEPVDDPLIE